MGSLADELEKVKVQLPRSKTVSSSRALSHPWGRSAPACPEPPEEMEPFRPKVKDEKDLLVIDKMRQ